MSEIDTRRCRASRKRKKHMRKLAWHWLRHATVYATNQQLRYWGRVLHGRMSKFEWGSLWWSENYQR